MKAEGKRITRTMTGRVRPRADIDATENDESLQLNAAKGIDGDAAVSTDQSGGEPL